MKRRRTFPCAPTCIRPIANYKTIQSLMQGVEIWTPDWQQALRAGKRLLEADLMSVGSVATELGATARVTPAAASAASGIGFDGVTVAYRERWHWRR